MRNSKCPYRENFEGETVKKDLLTLLSLMGFLFGSLITSTIFIMNLPVYLSIAAALLSLISAFYFFILVFIPGIVLFRDINILHDNASLIRGSGALIASKLCTGNLYPAIGPGILPMIKVCLHPKGIWVKLPLIEPIGLFYNEIENISIRRSLPNIVEIRHNSNRIINPICLFLRKKDLLIRELGKMINQKG